MFYFVSLQEKLLPSHIFKLSCFWASFLRFWIFTYLNFALIFSNFYIFEPCFYVSGLYSYIFKFLHFQALFSHFQTFIFSSFTFTFSNLTLTFFRLAFTFTNLIFWILFFELHSISFLHFFNFNFITPDLFCKTFI